MRAERPEDQARRREARAHLYRVLAIVASTAVLTLVSALTLSPRGKYRPGELQANLARYIQARHGLDVDAESIVLPEPGGGSDLLPRGVYFLARAPGQKWRDVYFADVILSRQAIPVRLSPAFNISRTSAADEADLRHGGGRYLAYASSVEGRASSITILDLAGLSATSLAGFNPLQRLQQRLTNLQESGRWAGLDRIEVELTVPQPVRLSWQGPLLRARGRVGSWDLQVDPQRVAVLRGPARARLVPIGKRTFLAWAVDTVRSFSFVGPEKIAWLENAVYGVVDQARRMSGSKLTDSDIRDEMALPVLSSAATTAVEGWPPKPLRPFIPGALKGEGEWVEVKGPFVRAEVGRPAFFAMTFLRPDPERLFARVYFVAWDPRRLELRMVAGTAEPRSATGELGQGVIPRDERLLPRVVAAFNGGFQSVHGDFGMMEERKVLCPPKPWAATVARLADGSTGFGTWDGESPAGWVPEWISSFRQNLTPLVEDFQFNPWKRGSWGGGAGFLTGSGPTAQIIRSGICLHGEGHVFYVLGNPVDGPTLGKAMQKAGCNYGLELDINSGHVGFEFYNVLAPGETAPASFTEEKYFARTGSYPGVGSLRYYMREVVRGTGNSPVPRYIGREARDFFYLVRRELLPGPDLPVGNGQPNDGRWTSAALPAAGVRFPPSFARTLVHVRRAGREARVHLLKTDLRWQDTTLCVPKADTGCLPADSDADKPLAILPLGELSSRALLADGKSLAGSRAGGAEPFLTLRPRRPEGPMLPALTAKPGVERGSISVQPASHPTRARSGRPLAALGVAEETGQLLYASGLNAEREDLSSVLERAGCRQLFFLGEVEPLLLLREGGTYQSLFGDIFPPVATTASLILRRGRVSWAPRIFTHVKPQPRSVWTLAQPERTRASALHRAQKTCEALGIAPPKSLGDLCRPPYSSVKELLQYRWRDPQTGRVCSEPPATTLKPRVKRGTASTSRTPAASTAVKPSQVKPSTRRRAGKVTTAAKRSKRSKAKAHLKTKKTRTGKKRR